MKKIIYLILPVLLFFACSSNDKKKCDQHLRMNMCYEPQSLDPRKTRELNDVNMAKLLFEGLMRVDESENIVCGVADKYEISSDNKTYVFTLKDAFWSNGDKLTAYDFEYTWKKILDPDFISASAFSFFCINNAKAAKEGLISSDEIGIKAVDDKILMIELEKPLSYFFNLLTNPCFFAVNKKVDMKNPNWHKDAHDFVCNGPFLLDEWKHYDKIEVKKNPNYYDSSNVKLNKISMFMLTTDTELNMFELNELDWAGSPYSSLPVDSFKKLKTDMRYNTQPYLGISFLRINIDKIQNLELRKALLNSIDRKSIVEHILQGGQKATKKFVPSDQNIENDFVQEDFNKQKIVFNYVNGDRSHLLAQTLQRCWEKNLNIIVELQALEKKTFFDRIAMKDYEIATGSWLADFDDPINFLQVFKYNKSSNNTTGWQNEQYIELLNKSDEILDPNQRKNILEQAENILLEDVPIIPICQLSQNYLKSPKLKNVVLHKSGFLDLRYAYFDSNEKL